MSDKLTRLTSIFESLKASGKVHNQTEFAEYIGVNKSTVSAALSGNERYLTDRLLKKIEFIMDAKEEKEPEKAPGIFLPGSTLKLYEAMVESNKELSSTVKTQQDTIRMLVEIIREDNGVKKGPSADLPGDIIRDTP